MPVAIGILSMMTLGSRLPVGNTYTLLPTNSVLTKMCPWHPARISRASSTPEAQVSTLKPGGSLNFSSAAGRQRSESGRPAPAPSSWRSRSSAGPWPSPAPRPAPAVPMRRPPRTARRTRRTNGRFPCLSPGFGCWNTTLARSIVSAAWPASRGTEAVERPRGRAHMRADASCPWSRCSSMPGSRWRLVPDLGAPWSAGAARAGPRRSRRSRRRSAWAFVVRRDAAASSTSRAGSASSPSASSRRCSC